MCFYSMKVLDSQRTLPSQWDSLMSQAAQNMDVLSSMDNIKILANVLKTNVAACTSIGPFFLPQIGRIFLDMLGLYKAVSGIISETVNREGEWTRCTNVSVSLTTSFKTFRQHRDKDTQNPSAPYYQEGNSEADGNVHSQG